MAEPSLSELTYRPDPSTAEGDRVVVADNSRGIQDIIGAAQQAARYNFLKYQDYQNRVSDAFKNFKVDYSGINPNHAEELRKRAGEFYSVLSKDAGVLANPEKNPNAYADIMSKYDGLQTSIAQSKRQQFYADSQEKFMYDNPDLLTDTNKKKVSSIRIQPLGEFQPEELEIPDVIDFSLLAKGKDGKSGLLGLTQTLTPVNERQYIDEIGADGKPTGKKSYTGMLLSGNVASYDYPSYIQKAGELYRSNQPIGKYNQSVQKTTDNLYRMLPDGQKAELEFAARELSKKTGKEVTPQEMFFTKSLETYFDRTEDRKDLRPIADPNFITDLDRAKLNIDLSKLGIERAKLAKADNQDVLGATGVLSEVVDIIKKGDAPENYVNVADGNKTKRVFKIGDPNILQKFGNIDKNGNVTNVPDEARYNPKTNEIDLVYLSKDDNDQPKLNVTGGYFIDQIKPLNARTWVNLVAQRSFGGQDRGAANQLLQEVITKNGGDLYKIATGKTIEDTKPKSTTNKQSKIVSAQTIKSLVGTSGYEGYTEKELQDYYKSNGYTIK